MLSDEQIESMASACGLYGVRKAVVKCVRELLAAQPVEAAQDADFKNFHRLLCERFDYAHDEKDWKRDQLSLIEHVANWRDQFEYIDVQNHTYRRAMQKIMARLTALLDEDHFAAIEEIVRSAGVEPSPAPREGDERAATLTEVIEALKLERECVVGSMSQYNSSDYNDRLDAKESAIDDCIACVEHMQAALAQKASPIAVAQSKALPQAVLDALRFYAHGHHFTIDDEHQQFDTVSGEPVNWLHSERNDDCTMIEDGSIARAALCGVPLGFEEPTEPIEGEAFASATSYASTTIDAKEMQSERSAFDAWWDGNDIGRSNRDGDWFAWEAWQARAALAHKAAPVAVEPIYQVRSLRSACRPWSDTSKELAEKLAAEGKDEMRIVYAHPLNPSAQPVGGASHKWDEEGDHCIACGDLAWCADRFCSGSKAQPAQPEIGDKS